MNMFVNCVSTDNMYHQRTDIQNIYMNDVRRYEILSHDEQRELIHQAQHGKTQEARAAAIDSLVCSNQRFVVSVAKKMATNGNLMDLINEGNIGLMTAIQKFDLNKKFHFITYAVWWIKRQMIEYIANLDKMVKPSNAVKVYMYVKKANKEFFDEYERYPSLEELQVFLQERYNFRVPNLKDMELYQGISLNSECSDDDDSKFEDSQLFSKITSSNNVDVESEKDDNKIVVACLLSELPHRDAEILRSAFGIGREKKTCDNIADDTNLTRERVRQIIYHSLKKLKENNKHLKNNIL